MEEPKVTIKLTPGNRTVKGRRSLPMAEARRVAKNNNPIAYHFADPRVGGFDVLNSDRGWWVKEDGRVKLQKLVDAYCFYYTDDEAISYAGISAEQLKYFQELHPEFYPIKHAAKRQPDMHAKKKIVEQAGKDVSWAAWWLSRTQKETFSTRVEATGANGRDLFDGMAQEIRKLGEELRNEPHDDDDEEHPGTPDAGHPDAGPVGTGNEASPAETKVEGSAVPA
jgi:hypothetical protein